MPPPIWAAAPSPATTIFVAALPLPTPALQSPDLRHTWPGGATADERILLVPVVMTRTDRRDTKQVRDQHMRILQSCLVRSPALTCITY